MLQRHLPSVNSATFSPLSVEEELCDKIHRQTSLAWRRAASLILLVFCANYVFLALSLAANDRRNRSLGHSQKYLVPSKWENSDIEHSVLMVVAHPYDEVLWGGEYLLEEGKNTHVVVTCTKNRRMSERFEEFKSVQKRLGTHGEFLDGKDSPRTMELESHIRDRIQDLVCNKDWERIITHGPEGENGHPQHHLVHDAVVDATRKCCRSAEKLHVFEPHPMKNHVFSEAKRSVAELYKSQKGVIKTFRLWEEQIVPLRDYDYEAASQTCRDQGGPEVFRRCRLHEILDFAVPDYGEKLLSDQGIGCTDQEATQEALSTREAMEESSYSRRLETLCGVDEAPVFVTFAISTDEKGRWSFKDAARAIRIMYSSLVRSHGCAVQLNVHSNLVRHALGSVCYCLPFQPSHFNTTNALHSQHPKDARKELILDGSQRYTTMGTKMNGIVFHDFNEAYMNNPYNDKVMFPRASKWFALSRAKLDTYEEYLMNGSPQQPVWIDLDTLVFDRAAVNAPVPWVYGYQSGFRRNTCFGDMFSLDMETVHDIRQLEQELLLERILSGNKTTLPMYDLQGYFEILLNREHCSGSRLHIVQEEYPAFSFGFDCFGRKHPTPELLNNGVKPWKGGSGSEGKWLMCKNFRNEDAMVASMSFTASSFKRFFMGSDDDTRFDIIADEEAWNVLNKFFYNLSSIVL